MPVISAVKSGGGGEGGCEGQWITWSFEKRMWGKLRELVTCRTTGRVLFLYSSSVGSGRWLFWSPLLLYSSNPDTWVYFPQTSYPEIGTWNPAEKVKLLPQLWGGEGGEEKKLPQLFLGGFIQVMQKRTTEWYCFFLYWLCAVLSVSACLSVCLSVTFLHSAGFVFFLY
jgi:hypothetical protein